METNTVSQFIQNFKEYLDFYRVIEDKLGLKFKKELGRRNVKYLWGSRVKDIVSLDKKLDKQNKKEPFTDEASVFAYLVDLVAARILLHSSKDLDKVNKMIKEELEDFKFDEHKVHPDLKKQPDYLRRFRGYSANHFIIRWPCQKTCVRQPTEPKDLRIEIQVMSLWMVAFAEIEHDIKYKQNGEPTDSELLDVDVLCGVMNIGEIVSGRVWENYEERVSTRSTSIIAQGSAGNKSDWKPLERLVLDTAAEALGYGLLNNTKQIAENIKEHTEKQEYRHMSESQLKCLQAFKSQPYEEFKDTNDDRVPGTCVWVLKNTKYLQWLNNQKDDLLWISADPGCGKSVLSRSLVEKELRSTTSLSTCYYFFKDNDEQNSLVKALSALIHQLLSAQPQLLKHAIPAWEKNGEKLQNEVGELWRILVNVATDPGSCDVICVLDALDECRESDCKRLLEYLSKFYSHSSKQASRSSLKFLVTSRPYDNIETGFQDISSTIRLSGERENDQIHKEIDLVIRTRVARLAKNRKLSRTTTEKLEQWLLKMEHRTYLWLYLAFENIEEFYKYSTRPDLEPIESLEPPSTVDEAYEKILGRIKNKYKPTATKILHIIVGARRPLTIGEMAIALGLATHSNPQSFAEVKIAKDRLKGLLRLCGLFVFINYERVYLIHQTAKEFLIQKEAQADHNCWKQCLRPQDSEKIMATICIDYLLLDELDSIKTTEWDSYEFSESNISSAIQEGDENNMPKVEDLLEYAAKHWPEHLRNSTISSRDPVFSNVCRLYQPENNRFYLWFPLQWKMQMPYEYRQAEMNIIRLAAFNGHDIVLSHLLHNDSFDLEASDEGGRTALIWAANFGYKKVVKLLLDKSADINAQGRFYGNALQAASIGGHQAIVDLLLAKGANVNAQGRFYGNALQAASIGGHQAIVDLLLAKGANVNAQGGRYGSALQAALYEGHQAVVNLLLVKGADINGQYRLYGSILQAASYMGHQSVVDLLLAKGANVNAQGGYYGNALQAASAGGHQAIVDFLLAKGADVNAQGGLYDNALQAASAGGHQAVVDLLLAKGANAQGRDYGNTLSVPLKRRHQDID